MSKNNNLENLIINTIRTLAMDAVQKANSGHPGAPMGLAPVAFTLWDKFIRHNPDNPNWPNRDRFILSAGHASMLLYSILHIMGYDVTLEDLQQFRQLHGKCAGHPEFGLTPGVETTTGPLGQGAANSVGFAIAERWLASYFNRPGYEIIHHHIFVIAGDGCMMEGISGEAASLAGHLGLSNLTWIYDNNHVTIEGSTALAFSEDVAARFRAYHWYVQQVKDANDLEQVEQALRNAREESERPSLVIIDSHIAYGSPKKQDSASAHGAPLGEDEVKATKKNYGWDPEKKFFVPDEINDYRQKIRRQGQKLEQEWHKKFAAYEIEFPELAKQFNMLLNRELPENWQRSLPEFPADAKGIATRTANGKILNAIAAEIPWLLGGAADLVPSTQTDLKGASSFQKNQYSGRNFHFGVRENAMSAIVNGMALARLRPYAATFLVFSDYLRPSLRLSALMRQPVIYIFTHDSIGVGEDGPTHQPVEHVASLRAIPHLEVIRPADANELAALWKYILPLKDYPVALILSRQSLPTFDRTRYASADNALKGAYILADCNARPEVLLLGSGSEVKLCLEAHEQLLQQGINARVVSMPCWSLFDRQDPDYRETVLPGSVRARVAVEAGATQGWCRYVGKYGEGSIIGVNTFGASAPIADLMEEYGFTVARIVEEAKNTLARINKNF